MTVQACLLGIGSQWLINWIEQSQFQALTDRLDSKSDVIEDMVVTENGKLFYQRSGEVALELEHDDDTYFELKTNGGEFISESEGPSAEVRERLRNALINVQEMNGKVQLLRIKHGRWLVQTETINRKSGSEMVTGIVHVGLNAAPTLAEISDFKKIIRLAALATLLLTGLGSVMVVSYSTRNLRKFATQLRTPHSALQMPNIELTPLSAEEKLLFDSYSEMAKAIKVSMDNQRVFIANASHELKTPIAAVMSALEVALAKERSAHYYQTVCQEILTEIKGLTRLTSELLNMAKLESPPSLASGQCNILEVINHVCTRWARAANDKSINIKIDSSNYNSPVVVGTIEQWDIILSNLIDNAIKYGKENGNIWISIFCHVQNECEILVKDDGLGMSETELHQLGNLFFRADLARASNKSFGLGFAHAKAIAEKINLKLTVESHLSQGTCIKISGIRLATLE